MSSAERNPSPKNKQLDPIALFREEYAAALADAEVSAQHTATEGWQRLYASRRKADRDARRAVADSLRNLADRLEVRPLEEDEVKEFAQVKAAYVEADDNAAGFTNRTVFPVREPVNRCDALVTDHLFKATSEEERTPLHSMGLEESMRMAIASVPRPRWDDDLGRVEIVPPSAHE